MSKTVIDNTSIQNKLNAGTNRCSLNFAVDAITLAGTTSGTKCSLKNVADPTSSSDAVTKSYVDSKVADLSQGMSWKDPVKAKSDTNLDCTATNSSLTAKVAAAISDVDGVAIEDNDRILVAGQTNKAENGIYVVTAKGSHQQPFILDRATDADAADDLTGATTTVLLGTEYANVVYVQKNVISSVGTDNVEWVQTSSAINSVSATDGLVKQGAYVKLNPDNSTIGIEADQVAVLQNGITTRELADDSVTSATIAAGAVDGTAVADNAITNLKLAGEITGDKIANNTLTSNLYKAQSVDAGALKLRSVNSQVLALGAVASENIAAGAVDADAIGNQVVSGSVHISPNSLVTNNYAQNSIDQAALAAASVGSTELKSNAVTTAKILAGNVTNSKLDDTQGTEAVDTNVMRDASVTKDKIALASVDEERLTSNCISNTKLQDGCITSNKFGTLTSLDVAGGISCSDLTVGGSGGSGSSFALCKMVFNHINIDADYAFSSSFKRICNNNVTFEYDDKVVAINGTARLIYKSTTGHSGTLGFVLGVRYWNDTGTAPEAFTDPVAYDTFSVGRGDTQEKEAILQGFGADNAGSGAKYIFSVSWWAREVSGNALVSPANQDFISTIQVVNDSSSKQEQTWDGTQLISV